MTPQTRIQLGAALEFVRSRFGGDVTEVESNPTIGTTVADVCLGNGDRLALVIVNAGSNNLFIAVNAGVSGTNGIELSSGGGVVAFDAINDFTLPTRNWKGIATVGNTSVYVLEIIRINRAGSPA